MKKLFSNADEEMKKDDWVMGEVGKADLTKSTDQSRIEERYLRDYAMHWTNFVRGTDVKPYRNRDDAVNTLSRHLPSRTRR